ncbi:hypothetical protein BDDG_02396 [Blastomyces dermatitidis ATCC 18188]|uniref:Uncharacterized protein n=1 Tax=Ajellomyces dermatitidis (strain ATCC 18188 / CBS 674.68) TaxID=653446 RepID=F2T893_AJEDA|nr:hypothetical protein BDDG_02396 [Blastomyces dermatitidis ATCC 18188]EQL32165.1 hypothetical protein BDFG_05647 [Blastomyces dermatitidis ATCC 26199]
MREKLQIELLKVTVLRIKLFSESSLNDHMRSYTTMLIEKRGSVTMMMKRAENRSDTDKPAGRRNDTSLQGTVTIITAARDAEERENVAMKVMLSQLIDIAVFTFN